MTRKNASIRHQLVRVIMLTSGTVLLLTSMAFIGFEWIALRRAAVESLTTLGQVIAENSAAPLAFSNPSDAREVLSALKAEPRIRAAALYDQQGALFATFPPGLGVTVFPKSPPPRGHRFSHLRLVLSEPVVQRGAPLGTVYLESDLSAVLGRLRLYAVGALAILGGALFMAFFFSRLLQQSISGPILALAETARRVSAQGDYSVRAPTQGEGEPGVLTEAFNRMLDEIQARQEELRRLKEELEVRVDRRTAELASANKELEAFGYSVSHDLRAPLRHVGSYIKLLDKQAGASLDEKGRRYVQIIAEAAQRMGRLIDDLLVLSRLGRTTMTESPMNLRELVQEALRELAPDTAGRAIEWHIGPLPGVRGDRSLLHSAVGNLLSNAIKYTQGRTPARIEIGSREEVDEVICFVRDNGAGFDMQFIDKLFGVFQRLHRAEEFAGTGIGLASVRRVIQRHGGRTWAEGEVGRGATFYFSIPNERILRPQNGVAPRHARSDREQSKAPALAEELRE